MYWKDLEVWQRAHSLVLKTYKISRAFPEEEKFGLRSQLRRAAVSVPANIVEGHARQSTKEYIQFLCVARGSLEEARYYSLLAEDLGYLSQAEHDQLEAESESVSRMINALVNALRMRKKQGRGVTG